MEQANKELMADARSRMTNPCNDVADDVFDGDEEWCDITGDQHRCVLAQDHLGERAHECNCGATW